MARIKTICLSGKEKIVTFPKIYPFFWIQNLAEYDVYISFLPNIQEDADGVIHLPPYVGDAVLLNSELMADTLYIYGKGEVQVYATTTPYCPFG